MKKYLLPVAALVALATTPALAATVIQTDSIGSAALGTSTPVSFLQFNSSLGTLDSVTLSFDANMPSVSGVVSNNAGTAKSFTLTEGSTAGLTGNGFDLSATLGSGSETVDVPAKGSINVGPVGGSGSNLDTLTTGLSAFEGAGNLAFDFTRTSLFSVSENGRITIDPAISGDATLTYNYTANNTAGTPVGAVPEPVSWAMLLIGFFGLGATLRFRRDRSAAIAA